MQLLRTELNIIVLQSGRHRLVRYLVAHCSAHVALLKLFRLARKRHVDYICIIQPVQLLALTDKFEYIRQYAARLELFVVHRPMFQGFFVT